MLAFLQQYFFSFKSNHLPHLNDLVGCSVTIILNLVLEVGKLFKSPDNKEIVTSTSFRYLFLIDVFKMLQIINDYALQEQFDPTLV
jgi:hypothetical protein